MVEAVTARAVTVTLTRLAACCQAAARPRRRCRLAHHVLAKPCATLHKYILKDNARRTPYLPSQRIHAQSEACMLRRKTFVAITKADSKSKYI